MDQERYPVTTDRYHVAYEFLSEGPRGTIKKVVLYQKLAENYYNLAFGDWNEDELKIDDIVRSNNSDRDKVLRTVALTIIDFIRFYPDAIVFLKGSTTARTRLYQIGILENQAEVAKLFNIQGFVNGDWEAFEAGKNYEAFALKRK